MEVTTAATCRAAAPRRAFILIFVFVKAPPPVWRRGECRDVGRPAPCLLLLLLEIQMGMGPDAERSVSQALQPQFSLHAPSATQPFRASPQSPGPGAEEPQLLP